MIRISPGVFLVVALALTPAPGGAQQRSGMPTTGGWQAPPPPTTWPAQEHHGYQDGVQAAWIDLKARLSPDPARHLTYKHPRGVIVSRRYRYREGFRNGYDVVYEHFGRLHTAHPAAAAGRHR